MFGDLLRDYDNNEYVYILDGCLDFYVDTEKPYSNLGPCPVCGNYDWLVAEGYVYFLKQFDTLDQYNKYIDAYGQPEKPKVKMQHRGETKK